WPCALILGGYVGCSLGEGGDVNLAAHHEGSGGTALLGRARMVASITARVSEGQAVVLRGARGMGRTTVLAAVAAALPRPIEVRLHRHGSEGQGVRTL